LPTGVHARRNEINDRLRGEEKEAALAGSRARDTTASRAPLWSIAQGCARKVERPALGGEEIHQIHWADRRRTSPASQHCSLTRLGANGTHTEAPTNSLSEHSNASNETEPRRILNPGLYLG